MGWNALCLFEIFLWVWQTYSLVVSNIGISHLWLGNLTTALMSITSSFSMWYALLFRDLLEPPVPHHSSCPWSHSSQAWRLKRVSCLFITHIPGPGRTHRRSQSWNKHVSTRSGVYYASSHSQNRPLRNIGPYACMNFIYPDVNFFNYISKTNLTD